MVHCTFKKSPVFPTRLPPKVPYTPKTRFRVRTALIREPYPQPLLPNPSLPPVALRVRLGGQSRHHDPIDPLPIHIDHLQPQPFQSVASPIDGILPMRSRIKPEMVLKFRGSLLSTLRSR